MIQVELSHDQIMALLYAIGMAEHESLCNGGEIHETALIEAKLTLQNAAEFEDHIIMPDGHRLPDERDR